MTEYKDALNWLHNVAALSDGSEYGEEMVGFIERALKIAERLIQEPSEGMINVAENIISHFDGEFGEINCYMEGYKAEEIFKAMRDQLIKEVNNDDA